MHAIILSAILLSFSGWAFDPNCVTDAIKPVETPLNAVAQRLNRTCSFSDLYVIREGETPVTEGFSPRGVEVTLFTSATNEELCNCLKSPGLMKDTLPSPEVSIQPNVIEQSTLSVLREELLNLQANVAKVKNLNLHSSLHEPSKSLCSPAIIQQKIVGLKQKLGSNDCPISEGMFESRTRPLFNGVPEEIETNLNEMATEIPGGYCISRAEYARMRSSNSFAYIGLRLFRRSGEGIFQESIIYDTTDNFSSMLPYDVLFDLAFRYPDIQEKIHLRYKTLSESLNALEIVDAIYSDLDVQKAAFEGVEKQCKDFSDNVERFICNKNDTTLEPMTASLVASINLGDQYQEPVKQSVIDFVTKNNSCKEPQVELGGHNKILNDYITERALQSRLVKGPFSQSPGSEYHSFNKNFCRPDTPKPLRAEHLSDMMKFFIQQKQFQGKNILTFFNNENVIQALGFKIDLNANPIIVPDSPDGEYPQMDRSRWDAMKDSLGLPEEDAAQLFTLLEMQTNSRRRELIELKRNYEGANPGIPELTTQAYDQILRSPPGTVLQIPGTNQTIVVNSVQYHYQQQQEYRQERFTPNNNSNNRSVNNVFTNVATQVAAVATTVQDLNTNSQQSGDAQSSSESVTELSNRRTQVQQAPVVTTPTVSTGIVSGTSTISSSKTEPDKKQKPVVSTVTTSDTTTISPTRVDTSETDRIKNEIKQIQDEIAKKQQEFDSNNRTIQRLSRLRDAATTSSDSSAQTTFRQNYNYPRNLPVRTESGDYYQPDVEGAELSSASNVSENSFVTNKPQGQERSSKGGSSGSVAGATASAGKGSVGGGSGSSAPGSAASGAGRGPASVDNDEKLREELNLPVYEFPRYIPQSMIDMIGSIEKVVLLLGLEGKQFKTIEAIEEVDPKTGKLKIRYFERIYDFVPGRKFSEFAKAMKDKTERAKLFETYFSYKRGPASLVKSRSYAKATKEVHKEEVEHSYVLENQNKILSEEEIRAKMAVSMELLK